MKTFFPNNRRILLIGAVINLLILAIVVIAATGPSLGTYAQMAGTQHDHIPPCSTPTPTPNPGSSANACPNQPTCPVNPQSFQHSDIWPVIGPALLTMTSQELQDQHGQRIGVYDLYGRLLLQAHCSIATLAQTLKIKGQPIPSNQAYLLEQDTLVQIAVAYSSNTHLLLALVWAAGQTNSQQLDAWFSAAIITNPINPNAPSSTSSQSSTSNQPSTNSQLTPSTPPPSGVSVDSPPSPIVQVKMVKKNGKYVFEPPIVMITKGTKVVWTNASDDSHTVTSDTNAFTASPLLAQTQTFPMVFNTAGTFAYHCAKHPYMKALVVVTP